MCEFDSALPYGIFQLVALVGSQANFCLSFVWPSSRPVKRFTGYIGRQERDPVQPEFFRCLYDATKIEVVLPLQDAARTNVDTWRAIA